MSIVIPKLDKVHTTIEAILFTYPDDGLLDVFGPHQVHKHVNEFRRFFIGKVCSEMQPRPLCIRGVKRGEDH